MANINLTTQESGETTSSGLFSSGLVVMFIVLVLVMAAYGALLALAWQTDKDIAQTKSDFSVKYAALSEGKGKELVDYYNRLNIAKDSLAKSRNAKETLGQIESLIVPGVYLSSYGLADSTGNITLNCVGDTYNTVAKQILNFKKSEYFSGVTAGSTTHGTENNIINFNVILKLK
jgi:hypothetical protein